MITERKDLLALAVFFLAIAGLGLALLFREVIFQPSVTGPAAAPPAENAQPGTSAGRKVNPNILWTAELGAGDLSEFTAEKGGGIYNSGTGIARVDPSMKHNGQPAIKLSISDADGLHGSQAVRLFRWKEANQSREAYYSVWLYFPEVYRPAEYWNVIQWKSKSADRNDPFWIVNVGNRPDGQMYFYLYDWQHEKSFEQDQLNIPVRRWVHVEAFYREAQDQTGQITVWQDGKLLFDVQGAETRYDDGDIEWSVNNYTTEISPSSATIYVSQPTISKVRLGPS